MLRKSEFQLVLNALEPVRLTDDERARIYKALEDEVMPDHFFKEDDTDFGEVSMQAVSDGMSAPTSTEMSKPKVPYQSLGEYLVGSDFNPSGDVMVNAIKRKAASLIDLVDSVRCTDCAHESYRLVSLAIDSFEAGAMWAVKATTKRDRR